MMIRRRTLLVGAAAALAGCTVAPTQPTVPPATPQKRANVAELLASSEFYVAHRGSGDNWPEHTLAAYLGGLAAGAQAVEISVRRTADDVLVCHHDADSLRVTGRAGTLLDLPYAALGERPVDARQWLGDATQPEPIPRLADVLAALPQDCLVFIEDKDGSNTAALLALMDEQPRATERFVWKQWAPAPQVAEAREHGYLSWGYLTDPVVDRLQEVVGNHDALGVPVGQDDAVIARFVATGKPVIAWEVHTRYQRDRLAGLGVAGMMCSNVPYVISGQAIATADSFATGRRAAGDLPPDPQNGWAAQPRIVPGEKSVTLTGPAATPRYLLGSLSPITMESYALSVTVAWLTSPDSAATRAGFSFGFANDARYHPRQANVSGSYQAFVTGAGQAVLAYQPERSDMSTELAVIALRQTDQVELRVTVSPQQIIFDANGQSSTVAHTGARGGYLWLWGEQVARGVRLGPVNVHPA